MVHCLSKEWCTCSLKPLYTITLDLIILECVLMEYSIDEKVAYIEQANVLHVFSLLGH